jgi:hypothetical protein
MIGWMSDANDTPPDGAVAGAAVVSGAADVVLTAVAVVVGSAGVVGSAVAMVSVVPVSPTGVASSLPDPSPQAATTTARSRHVPAPSAHDPRLRAVLSSTEVSGPITLIHSGR